MFKRADYAVFKSKTGLGLRANRSFAPGDSVIEYKGKRISTAQADENPNRYLFELDENITIDGSDRKNLARYVNHSCDPNCEAVHYTDENRVFIEAIKPIAAGEEITFDYGKDHFDEYIKPFGCKCSKCAGKNT